MSTEADQARSIAERIARRVAGERSVTTRNTTESNNTVSAELAAVRATLSELQKRLAQIEAKVQSGTAETTSWPSRVAQASPVEKTIPLTHSPWLVGVNAGVAHPSQERFGVEEAVVSELVDFFENEKTCGVEPGGKVCDHCEMCSTRGF